MVPVSHLKDLHIFKNTSASALERLAKDMVSQDYKKGDVICREGEQSAAIFLVMSGAVSVKKKTTDKESELKTVARLEREEFFGEMSFMDHAPYSATVVADEPTQICALPRSSLNDLVKTDPATALDNVLTLLSGLSSRLRRTTTESVSVYEVARLLGAGLPQEEFAKKLLQVIQLGLGSHTSLAFYRWNPFNDEYFHVASDGERKKMFPEIIDISAPLLKQVDEKHGFADVSKTVTNVKPLNVNQGHLALAPVNMGHIQEALLIFYREQPNSFDNGARQLIETLSAVLAPALATARAREEDEARARLERSKQERYYL